MSDRKGAASYSPELRARAVRLVLEHQNERGSTIGRIVIKMRDCQDHACHPQRRKVGKRRRLHAQPVAVTPGV